MADDTEILKVSVDIGDAETAFNRLAQSAEGAAQKVSRAFSGVKPSGEIEQHAKEVGKAFEEMAEKGGAAIKQLGARFGEGGSLIAELAEKITASIGKIPSAINNAGAAIGKIAETSKAAGGGMSGFAAAAASVGEALGPIGLAAGAAGAAVTTLIYAAASSASKLSDLRQEIEGSEADFARLEIAGRQTSLGTEAMAGAAVRIRDGFRSASVELQNYGEMLQVMQDREATAVGRTELLAEKRKISRRKAAGEDVTADEAALQEKQEKLSEKVAATMEERQKTRLERMRRSLQENLGGIARIFVGPELLQSLDPGKIDQLGKSIERIRGGVANVDELKNELKALADVIVETSTKGPAAMANLERGLKQAVGPHAARLLIEHAQEWQKTASMTNEAAEEMNQAMGGLSKEARENLDRINQDMHRMIQSFEEMATSLGALFSPLIGALTKASEAVTSFADFARKVFVTVAEEAGAATEAILRMVGATKQAENLHKAMEPKEKWYAGSKEGAEREARGERPGQRDVYGEQVKAAIENLPEMFSRPILDIVSRIATGHGYEERPAGQAPQGFGEMRGGFLVAPEQVKKVGDASEETAPKVDKLGENSDRAADSVKALGEAAAAATKTNGGGGGEAGGHQQGGYISGPGTATSDSILARLSNGEFVMSAKAVNHYGAAFMQKLNARMYAEGGLISESPEKAIPVLGLWDEDIEYTKLGYHRSRRTGHWLKANDEELTRDEIAQIDRQLRIKSQEETARILERDLEERQRAQDEAAMRKHADGGLIGYGAAFMQKLNARMYATGGLVTAEDVSGVAMPSGIDVDYDAVLKAQGFERGASGRWFKKDADGTIHYLSDDEERRLRTSAYADAMSKVRGKVEQNRVAAQHKREEDHREQDRAEEHAAKEQERERRHRQEKRRRDEEERSRLPLAPWARDVSGTDVTPPTYRTYAEGGLIEAFKGFAGGGFADSFADAFSLAMPRFAGGSTVSAGPAAALHPLYLSFNGGGFVGGLTATPSAVDQISRHAVLAQASSTMGAKPSWLR